MSTFRYEARVVTCAHCDAPVTGGSTAAEVTCSYCGQANQIVARDDRRDQDAAALQGIAEDASDEVFQKELLALLKTRES